MRMFKAAPAKTTADSDVVDARFIQLIPGQKVVQDINFRSEDPAFAGTMTMIWEISPVAGGSLLTISARNVPAGISAAEHQAGLASSLDNLAGYLQRKD
ncbi:SRPBCC domain-containing protein [Corynebacterium sp. A21]|uniref:SRPBCC domain-containing protein n=1 Tax=Corynebacterium sp. A21 TaxID=3457318 RepID=UPI003FD40823